MVFKRHVGHRIEGVGHNNDNGTRRDSLYIFAYQADDFRIGKEEVIPAHPGCSGDAGGDDDQVAPRQSIRIAGPHNAGVKPFHGGRLGQVEALALRSALFYVEQHHLLPQFLFCNVLGTGSPYVPGTDYANLHAALSCLRLDADLFSALVETFEGDDSIDQCEEGVVPCALDIVAGMNTGTPLPDENTSSGYKLAAEGLHSQALPLAVTAVSGASNPFFMRHFRPPWVLRRGHRPKSHRSGVR